MHAQPVTAQRPGAPRSVSEETDRRNRAFWNAHSDAYQRDHGAQLQRQHAEGLGWGVWSIPDAELGVLGDVAGRDVLELGCGAGHSLVALARQGARPVGLDLSERQLDHARKVTEQAGVKVPLLQASAAAVPLRPGRFDVIVSDHGALTYAPPEQTLPECARLLRGRGLLALLTPSPLLTLCWAGQAGGPSVRLQRPYFDLADVDSGPVAVHHRTLGDWVRLFRANNLLVEDLIEVRPPDGAETTFRGFAPVAWARRFPAEVIWKVRKGPLRKRRENRAQAAQRQPSPERG